MGFGVVVRYIETSFGHTHGRLSFYFQFIYVLIHLVKVFHVSLMVEFRLFFTVLVVPSSEEKIFFRSRLYYVQKTTHPLKVPNGTDSTKVIPHTYVCMYV